MSLERNQSPSDIVAESLYLLAQLQDIAPDRAQQAIRTLDKRLAELGRSLAALVESPHDRQGATLLLREICLAIRSTRTLGDDFAGATTVTRPITLSAWRSFLANLDPNVRINVEVDPMPVTILYRVRGCRPSAVDFEPLAVVPTRAGPIANVWKQCNAISFVPSETGCTAGKLLSIVEGIASDHPRLTVMLDLMPVVDVAYDPQGGGTSIRTRPLDDTLYTSKRRLIERAVQKALAHVRRGVAALDDGDDVGVCALLERVSRDMPRHWVMPLYQQDGRVYTEREWQCVRPRTYATDSFSMRSLVPTCAADAIERAALRALMAQRVIADSFFSVDGGLCSCREKRHGLAALYTIDADDPWFTGRDRQD